jgi:dephospho-CoA kinase
MSYIVGLTGGIGSGKTVASDHFASLGVPIVDTDIVAREIVETGQPALNELVLKFGSEILNNDGSLNRATLRTIAFSNDENKKTLDAVTHPAIRQETASQIASIDYPYCLVVVPLLTSDSPFLEFTQRVLIVTADHETKVERVKRRSGLSESEVLRIMRTQLTDEQRVEFADDIVSNNGTIEDAQKQVEALHHKYLELSILQEP